MNNRVESVDIDVMEVEPQAAGLKSASTSHVFSQIVIPKFAKIDHSKKYKVTNHRNYDQESPFNPTELLGATHFNGSDLAQQAHQIDTDAEIALPSWHLECKFDQVRLEFCHTADYENYIVTKEDEKDQVEVSQELAAAPHNETTETTRITDITEDVSISEEDHLKIENLPITQQTKDLIREKYYRGANHQDLQSFKVFDKNTSSLFYELFSVVYREKPAFEFEDVPNNLKGPKEYIAHMIFNNERLVQAQSNSKKEAKALASLRALEIFAPSLAAKHRLFVKVPEHPNVSAFLLEDIKIHELPASKKISNHIEEKKTADSGSDVVEIEIEDISAAGPVFFQESSAGGGIFEEMQKTLNEYDKVSAKKNCPPPTQATKPRQDPQSEAVKVNFNPVNGLKVTVSASATAKENLNSSSLNHSQDILCDGRDKSIQKLFDDLSEFLKTALKPRIDPKAPFSHDMTKAFKSYCQNRIFTKLYMLHCLIHKKERESLQINSLYYEKECHVYLYSTELDQTFMYRSGSFVFSVEAAKYFLIFTIYDKCQSLPEIISTMRAQKEQTNSLKYNKPVPDKTNLFVSNEDEGESSEEIKEIESSDFVSSKTPNKSMEHSRSSAHDDAHKDSLTKNSFSPKKKPSVKDRMIEELDFL